MAIIGVSSLLTTFLGALISGLVGVALFLIKSRSEDKGEVEDWYTRCVQFSRQIQNAGRDGGPVGDKRHTLTVAERIQSSLLEHSTQAPKGVENDILNDVDALIQAIGDYSASFGNQSGYSKSSAQESLINKAKQLEESAEQEREKVSWL